MGIWTIMIVTMVASLIIQQVLQSKFNKYSKEPVSNGMTGAQVAEKMLREHGIFDVKVTSTPGMLTDLIARGPYPYACCTACPHSCAATAAAATLLLE